MQHVTMRRQDKHYDLGHILPVMVGTQIQYAILPNFPFRPPFITLRLKHAQTRMYVLAKEHIEAGGKLDYVADYKLMQDIEPEHVIHV